MRQGFARHIGKTMKKGFLIVVDGGDGAGKGTCLRELESHLRNRGFDVVMTREPGGTQIGERIRDLLLDKSAFDMCPKTELLLFAAARAQHVQEKISPAINSGKIVISDRFASSTVSFQHYGRGLSLDLIKQLNAIALGGVKPSMTIILDLDPHIGLQRVTSRGGGLDRLEDEGIAFLERARQGYLEQAKEDPSHFVVIDASRPAQEVFAAARRVVDSVIATEYH